MISVTQKILLTTLFLVLTHVEKGITADPYFGIELKFSNESIEASVIIDASIDEVWNFVSDDANAAYWSVFFAKIVPCPTTECPKNKTLSSTDIGFIRRVLRNGDEKGLFWDEEITIVEKDTDFYYKRIRAHNFYGYLGETYQKSWEIKVEQEYVALSSHRTKLIFRATPFKYEDITKNTNKNPDDDVSMLKYRSWKFLFKKSSNRTREIFKKNLENIKHNIENGISNHPIHSYEKTCDERHMFCPDFISDF